MRNSASPGLVVFIDDLDRCHARNVVELLEAINFIVSAGQCFVILGIAKDQIRRSILANYKSEFLDVPKETVRGGDIEAARRRFAERYLEKLINIEVPVPQATAAQIEMLLTGTAKSPRPVSDLSQRRRFRIIYDNGPAILAAGFLVALFIWLHPYLGKIGMPVSTPPIATQTAPPSIKPNGQQSPATVGDLTVPPIYMSDQNLSAVTPRVGFPWADLTLTLVLFASGGAYLIRRWVLAKQRPASDSPAFRKALEMWSSVIFLASRTPRAVKQYKNLLRYQASRVAGLKGRMPWRRPDEPDRSNCSLGDSRWLQHDRNHVPHSAGIIRSRDP